ncbi:MAG: hypothetical protein JW955_11165 [Sedimentisphaerales bacterium]|nr:hypothetical protein [Sedimentisphaerales bacterium]
MKLTVAVGVMITLTCGLSARADCPLDHFIIGRNGDGIEGTDDDNRLFVDCSQKYRDSGQREYANWFYPLQKSIFPSYTYRIGEPGFDAFQGVNRSALAYDPNRALGGDPDVDYAIVVVSTALSPGMRAVHKDYPQFTIDAVGQTFSHSYIHSLRGDPHMHMSYQAMDGQSLQWMTFQVFDAVEDGNQYEPSEPFTIVFNAEPLAGDLAVDGCVDRRDLSRLCHYWLSPASSTENDYCERADTNRDGRVDLVDFARMASNWLNPLAEPTFP